MNHQSTNKHRSFLNSWKNSSSSRHHDRNNNNNNNRNHTSSNSSNNNTNTTIVGTEKIAYNALQRNSIAFKYPKLGFITKIEYSLLYTMMNHPNIYPKYIIRDMIQQEDYIQYIYVNEPPTSTTTTTSSNQNDPSLCSYAQLSALLALAAEKWPPPSSSSSPFQNHDEHNNNNNNGSMSSQQQQQTTSQRRNYNDDNDSDDNNDDDEYNEYHQRRQRQQQSNTTGNTDSTSNTDDINIVQILCQLLIQCIIRHCNEHQLDRETEINELFVPFQKVVSDQANKSALLSVVPAYIGMTATILTGGNPIPFYIGYAMSINAIAQQEKDLANYKQIASTTSRMSNIETTNLLHDTD